jgi:hypothetical protein
MIDDPALKHVHFDISWDGVAKYVVATPEVTQRTANLVNRHPERSLFGTDEVAAVLAHYRQSDPLWRLLMPEPQRVVKRGNYERYSTVRAPAFVCGNARTYPRRQPDIGARTGLCKEVGLRSRVDSSAD